MDSGQENFFLSGGQPLLGLSDVGAAAAAAAASAPGGTASKKKPRRGVDSDAHQKRRCVSTACIACRRRKSKCDGALPSCAACASVYGTECIYDPNSDHRRKGVYREKIDSMKARSSTLQILIEAILNASEEEVPIIVKKIRTCESLDTVAESILKQDYTIDEEETDDAIDDDAYAAAADSVVEGERDLARKMGELRLENGSVRFIGGTSHLLYLGDPNENVNQEPESEVYVPGEDPITSWTNVTKDPQLIIHLINMYFAWHYPFFTCLSRSLFYRDFLKGKPRTAPKGTIYCSSLLVHAMLSLGCHFTAVSGAFPSPEAESRTKGDHFFAEAKRLIVDNDEYEKPRLVTVQALALMSVREAGCGREAKGWVYSGMSFRMAQDLGLNLNDAGLSSEKGALNEHEIDARRITFWGCFLFDKCWSNYLGRLPQLAKGSYSVPKYDVFPNEDAETWSAYTDNGFDQSSKQPARTRACGLQFLKLLEISSDLLMFFYHPNHLGRSSGKSVELKKLSELHRRLEDWRKELPKEFEPREGQLPNVILVHMFFHTQYIHLFRPFLKYTPAASPLPSHVSPRRICTANAGAISKLMRLYKKSWNLRQIPNIAIYMLHSACIIHILNLPEKTAKRDIIHGVKHLEEVAEDWIGARRTLSILSVLSRKWGVELPEEASLVLQRTDEKWGTFSMSDVPSPPKTHNSGLSPSPEYWPNTPPSVTTSSPAIGVANKVENSPQPQFGSPQLGQDLSRNASDLLIGNPSLATLNSMRSQVSPPQQAPQPQISVTNGGINLSNSGGWPPPVAQAMSNFQQQPQPFSMPPTSSPLTSAVGRNTRQISPSAQSLFPETGMDDSDWFLNDGVRWHQNFGAWGLSGAAAASSPSSSGGADSVFMFRGAGGAAGTGTGGLRTGADDGFSGFDMSTLNNGGWLGGLD